ncbi:MAG: AAA family ATPase [Candidatus Accumulibacter sp.]|uniref:AAA family ATPase n=1 Tax=Accumulibacter sp. TaxID=2053492 RepID=UPI00258E5AB0|nr:AAA family ATPase [Accumulibacter sp.]MBK8117477.1 AAA family ATPase [Accumulibacter sp.]
MKITAIKTSNFLGSRDVDVKLAKPICLFAGKNFSGKSSLQEAVRMALTGESVRVSLKKELRPADHRRPDRGIRRRRPRRRPSCPTSWTHSDFQACRPMIGARSCLA